MRISGSWLALCVFGLAGSAYAQEEPLVIEGTAPEGPETHFFVAFEVTEGTAEIEVRHENLSSENVLDWGLDDPNGFRGWGGGNSEPAIVGVEAASRSYVPGPLPVGMWEVVVGKASIIATPAQYRIEIFLRSEPTLPPQPRTPYEDPGALDDEARWYAGDFHVHSRQSGDAQPSIPETLDVAEEAGLDFIMLSEHNTNSGLTLYGGIQPDHPNVLIMPGVEWTTYSGHANAIGATEWVDHKTGVRGATVEDAIDAFHAQGALFYPTHPSEPNFSLCLGCMWEYDVDPTTLDGAEAWGGIWDSIEFWEDLCRNGSHAVAIGGSDDHRGGQDVTPVSRPIGSPRTMVFAENLSVDAIMDGVRAGRTVVKVNGADDPMLETELSGDRVGDTVFADVATLSVVVTDGEGQTLEVRKNGDVIETIPIDGDPFTHEMTVQAPPEGEDRYRHQVIFATAPSTLGSYVWLRASEPVPGGSSNGCGCRVANQADYETAGVLLLVALGVFSRRRRRSRV
jgi:MYXO-CTERM domain-containing protein